MREEGNVCLPALFLIRSDGELVILQVSHSGDHSGNVVSLRSTLAKIIYCIQDSSTDFLRCCLAMPLDYLKDTLETEEAAIW